NLYAAIENLLGDPVLAKHPDYKNLVVEVYRHPLMQSLYRRTPLADKAAAVNFSKVASLPSYIPSRVFTVALLDVLRAKTASEATGMDQVLAGAQQAVERLPAGHLKTTLTLFVADADLRRESVNQRAQAVAERVEGWFNDSMSRASGWYKRQAQTMSLVIGLFLTVLINCNTFNVAERLWRDNALRAQVSATAAVYYKEQTDGNDRAPAGGGVKDTNQGGSVATQWNEQMKRLQASSLPIGWSADVTSMLPSNLAGWVALLFGWLVTGLAASLGAAFWFDVLGKVLQIRGSGPKATDTAPGRNRETVAVAAAAEQGETATSATVAVSSGGGGST
ncbi:MAG TPA: hypothetical protein VK550_24465, partial [Polyangiaceae bacterium]|nr:hypothetical protein [Polyangiaceae bacterium]